MENKAELEKRYKALIDKKLNLDMKRGQPSQEDLALSNPLISILDDDETRTSSGQDLRNYPGGATGLPEAKKLFSTVLGVNPEQMIVGNNSSLAMLVDTMMWAMLKGVSNSDGPWFKENPKIIVAVPGYDRHFKMLDAIGYEMLSVNMTPEGPDMDAVEEFACGDPSVKGMLFVPTYSNPTGYTISDRIAHRLASMKTLAKDFTIFADDAYKVHHLTDKPAEPLNLLAACTEAGNPGRVFLYGSTSKVTFAGAGIGFMGASEQNIAWISEKMGCESIGPNKMEQYRHVKFLKGYKGGIAGLIKDHAKILKPKFDMVLKVLKEELGDTGLASWTNPRGGYFISFNTAKPVADTVVQLAAEAGVGLTPAGATFPYGKDPKNSNIRIAPTRPSLKQLETATRVLCVCVKRASINGA